MGGLVKWGMIGCGSVAETKSGPAFYRCKGSALEYVMTRDKSQANSFAERHGVANWTTDYRDLVSSKSVDAIYVATPPDSHLFYATAAAKAGKPVLVEKPMARNLSEAQELVRCCSDTGVPLFVAYYRRALPRFIKVKNLLDTGAIGSPRFVHIQHSAAPENHPVSPIDTRNILPEKELPWRFRPEISGGGNFVDCGTHMLDMVDFLLGPITNIEGEAFNFGKIYPAEDSVHCKFIVNKNILGTGQWNYISGTEVDRIEITGSTGTIRVSCFDELPLELETSAGLEHIEAKNPTYWSQPFIQTVVDTLLGIGICPSNSDNGLRAMEVQDKLLAGYYSEA